MFMGRGEEIDDAAAPAELAHPCYEGSGLIACADEAFDKGVLVELDPGGDGRDGIGEELPGRQFLDERPHRRHEDAPVAGNQGVEKAHPLSHGAAVGRVGLEGEKAPWGEEGNERGAEGRPPVRNGGGICCKRIFREAFRRALCGDKGLVFRKEPQVFCERFRFFLSGGHHNDRPACFPPQAE